MMEVTKISSKGQITIPVEIRRKLGLLDGDKVALIQNEDGDFVIVNATKVIFEQIQKAFKGQAKKVGLSSEKDVVNMIKAERKK